jgi:transcriptional regulator with XRE-family HTH domain
VSTRTGQSVRQRKAAAELKRLRELALLTADEVAQRLGWSPSKVSRVENARIRLKPHDVALLLDLYDVAREQRQKLISLVEDDTNKNWWDAYSDILTPDFMTLISFEAEAASVLNYEPMVIPGLLQTEAYAHRVIHMWQSITNAPPPELDRRLEVRLARQRIISTSNPAQLTVIIDEAVLRRQIDERAVMREQLHYLLDASELPNVELRILPLSGIHVTSAGPIILMQIPEFGDVVYLEDFTDGHLHIKDAAVIYQHTLVLKELGDASLGLDESRLLIRRTADELWAP